MIIYLRYATDSQTRRLPPFVDSTDGDSEETGLTIANTDILIGKPGGTTLTAKHSGGATHISNGIYYATFDSSDSDTVGNGELYIHKPGALYCFATLVILPSNVYDSLFSTDLLNVNVSQISEDTDAANNAELMFDGTGYAGGIIKLAVDATLNSVQGSYAPAKAGDKMDLVDSPSVTGMNAIVDALLTRDWSSVTGEASRSVLNALRFLRNKWIFSGTTLSVKKEDDSTEAWNATVSSDESADPITGLDPN